VTLGSGKSIVSPFPGPGKSFGEFSLPEEKSYLGMSSLESYKHIHPLR
jgi:hypothetical protein